MDSFHDSYTSLAGGTLLLNMMLGEVAPGGVGSGLYGMLMLAVVTVFVAGLMVGRTPEYLGKKIGGREMKFASLYILTTPLVVLVGTAIAMALPGRAGEHVERRRRTGCPRCCTRSRRPANNNGSAFAGISVNTTWYNTALGLAMLVGRFLPIVFVLGAGRKPGPAAAGAGVRGHAADATGRCSSGMLAGVIVIVVALTYFPALALGPLAEGLH